MRFRLTLILFLLSFASQAATYYVTPTGAGAATGANLANAWSWATAQSTVASGDTLLLGDGTYGSYASGTGSFITIQSINKWGAKIVGDSGAFGLRFLDNHHTNTVDGLWIFSSYLSGLKYNGHGWTIKNCKIENAGRGDPAWVTNTSGTYTGQGIESHNWSGSTIERNLIRNCGARLNLDHGMYVSGSNNIIQYNVVNSNVCWGIQLYDGTGDTTGNIIRGNLVYGNGGIDGSSGGAIVNYMYNSGKTNYIFNNTLIAPRVGINVSGPGNLVVTNNIIWAGSGYETILDAGGVTVNADYNYKNQDVVGDPDGTHDVLNSSYTLTASTWFPGYNSGRFWTPLASGAVGAALTTLYTPQDWFGNAEASAADIGATQYDGYLEADTRNMYLSTSDYWTHPLSFTPPPTSPTANSSSIQHTLVSSNSARISWATDQSATSQVTYNGTSTSMDTALVRYHAILLSGLTPSTVYNYTVTSTNVNGSITSGTNTFTTLAVGYTTVSTNRFFGGATGF